MRSRSHVSNRVLTHFTASKWPLKVSICSIVPQQFLTYWAGFL